MLCTRKIVAPCCNVLPYLLMVLFSSHQKATNHVPPLRLDLQSRSSDFVTARVVRVVLLWSSMHSVPASSCSMHSTGVLYSFTKTMPKQAEEVWWLKLCKHWTRCTVTLHVDTRPWGAVLCCVYSCILGSWVMTAVTVTKHHLWETCRLLKWEQDSNSPSALNLAAIESKLGICIALRYYDS